MSDLTDEEAIALAVDGPPGFEGKAIPYLGWYWRDWHGLLALKDDNVVIDPANKWDLPRAQASKEDVAEITRLLVEMGRAKRRALDILATYKGRMRNV